MREKIKEYIDENRENIINDWKNLVNLEGRCDEIENMKTVAQAVYDLFTGAGAECEIIQKDPEAPPVVKGVIGKDRKGQPVSFTGHYDTVFKKGTFGENPFRIADGKAYGPGVLDMKGGIVITAYVIKALESIGYSDRPIHICFVGDEEGGKKHGIAGGILYEASQGCRASFNMETGPVNGNLCVGRKWVSSFSFTVHGVSAHSGNNYDAGRNALVEAAHKIIAIQNMNDMELGTNMNPAICHGGVVTNAIPDTVTVEGSGRYAYISEADRVKNELIALFESSFTDGTHTDYYVSDAAAGFEASDDNMALWKFVSDECEKYNLPRCGHVFLGGGSDAGYAAMSGVPVLCSCGVRGEWNHTDREYAVVESMYERCELWCNVVMDIDSFVK